MRTTVQWRLLAAVFFTAELRHDFSFVVDNTVLSCFNGYQKPGETGRSITGWLIVSLFKVSESNTVERGLLQILCIFAVLQN